MNGLKTTFVIRSCMVIVWLLALAFFFFSPTLWQYMHKNKTINVLIWPSMIDVKLLKEFEAKTGIKVHVTYYESNEELLRKFQITGGQGYDLVIAADHSIEQLIGDGLVKKLDKGQLTFFNDFKSIFLHHYFDPANNYSLPYYLGIYGLGVNPKYFKQGIPPASWSLLFDRHTYRVTMSDDPRRAIALAKFFLFGNEQELTDDQIQAITALLRKQKKWVELYSDVRGEELLAAESCPVVLTISPDLWRVQQEFPHLKFIIPQEGSFMVIDSFIIPEKSQKEDLAYQLLNYLYQPSILKHNATHYGFCPPLTVVDVEDYDLLCPNDEQIKKLHFFNNTLSKDALNAIWIAVMA